MKNKSNPVITANSSAFGVVRFRLHPLEMVESASYLPYVASRARVATAVRGKSKIVLAKLRGHGFRLRSYDYIASRASIHIGCMKFSGVNAQKLKAWALRKRVTA